MNKDILIDSLKKHLRNVDEIEFAFLYGSFALNKETPLSDIDIAVYQKTSKPVYDLRIVELKIESELTGLLPSYKFEIRSLNDAPLIVVGKIINDGVLLFYKNENFFFDYLVNNRIKFMDYSFIYNPLFNERYTKLLNDR
jgi:hypothetical protein